MIFFCGRQSCRYPNFRLLPAQLKTDAVEQLLFLCIQKGIIEMRIFRFHNSVSPPASFRAISCPFSQQLHLMYLYYYDSFPSRQGGRKNRYYSAFFIDCLLSAQKKNVSCTAVHSTFLYMVYSFLLLKAAASGRRSILLNFTHP